MTKILFNKNYFLKITAICFFYALFLCIVRFVECDGLPLHESFLMLKESYVVFSDTNELHIDVFMTVFILILIIPVILQIVLNDYKIAKAYIFVRLDNVAVWFKYKIIQTIVLCFFTSAIYNFSLLALAIFLNKEVNNLNLTLYYVSLGIFSVFLELLVFLLVGISLSFILREHYASTVLIAFLSVLIIINCFAKAENLKFSIIANSIVSWHLYNYNNPGVCLFSINEYFLLEFLVIFFEIIVGYKILKKVDNI